MPSSAASGGSSVFSATMPGRERRLDLGAGERGAEPARGDLDLGQLGHPE